MGKKGTEEAAASGEDEGCLSGSVGTIEIGLIGAASSAMSECLPDEGCGDEVGESSQTERDCSEAEY